MTTLGVMEDRIADELARSDLATQIRDAIRSAVNHYAGERWWFNENPAFTLTTSSSLEFYALPTNFERDDYLSIIIGGNALDLDRQSYDTIQKWQTNNIFGQPTDYAVYAEQLWFYPIPIDAYTVIMSHVGTVSTLSSTLDTNTMMTYGEELIRSRARADIQINFLRDEVMTGEYMSIAQGGEGYYSQRERAAYISLRGRTVRRTTSSKIRSTKF